MKKIFVGGLPPTTTEDSLNSMFEEYGKVHSLKLTKDLFSGACKGFGFIEMEGHEARAAIAGLNGKMVGERNITVKYETEKPGGRGRRR